MKRRRKILLILAAFVFSVFVVVGVISHGFKAAGYRMLQWSALRHHTALSKLLLAAGAPASPNKEIYEWDYFAEITNTPLHSAAEAGDVELARSLIEHGASLDWCCCSCVTPLHLAIIGKHPETVELLLKAGANTAIAYDLSASVLDLARTRGTPEIAAMIESHDRRLKGGAVKKQRVSHERTKPL